MSGSGLTPPLDRRPCIWGLTDYELREELNDDARILLFLGTSGQGCFLFRLLSVLLTFERGVPIYIIYFLCRVYFTLTQ
jgi:hypothetical protein